MSNQTGKQLFNRYSFAEIATAFTALWKYNEPKKAERLDLVQWEKLYQSIRQKDNHHLYTGMFAAYRNNIHDYRALWRNVPGKMDKTALKM